MKVALLPPVVFTLHHTWATLEPSVAPCYTSVHTPSVLETCPCLYRRAFRSKPPFALLFSMQAYLDITSHSSLPSCFSHPCFSSSPKPGPKRPGCCPSQGVELSTMPADPGPLTNCPRGLCHHHLFLWDPTLCLVPGSGPVLAQLLLPGPKFRVALLQAILSLSLPAWPRSLCTVFM